MPRKKKKKVKKTSGRGGTGHNRSQPALRIPKGGPRFNLQTLFMTVVEAFYLENLDPPVDEDTDTALAVRLHMCERATVKKLLAMVRMSCQNLYVFCTCLVIVGMSCAHVLPTFVCIVCMSCLHVLLTYLLCTSCVHILCDCR